MRTVSTGTGNVYGPSRPAPRSPVRPSTMTASNDMVLDGSDNERRPSNPRRGGFSSRGGGRGGRGGRNARNDRRGRSGDDEEDDSLNEMDTHNPHPEFGDVDPMDKDGYAFLDDHFGEQFVSEWDKRGYAEAMDQTSALLERVESIEKTQQEHKTDQNPQGEIALRCEEQLRDVDEGIKRAIETLEEYQDKALVPHKPQSIDLDQFYRRNIGAVPAGPAGAGMVLEDGLRYLGDREGHTFKYPRDLAKRLIAGEFVKFKSHTERREVIEALQRLADEKDAPKEWKKVTFMPLEPAARNDVAHRLVQGQTVGDAARKGELIEAGKMKSPQNVLDTVSRVAGGHYTGGQMQKLLQTVGEMLPSGAKQQSQAPARH